MKKLIFLLIFLTAGFLVNSVYGQARLLYIIGGDSMYIELPEGNPKYIFKTDTFKMPGIFILAEGIGRADSALFADTSNYSRSVEFNINDTSIYISNLGNDLTGSGTIGNPFATTNRALLSIPLKNKDNTISLFYSPGTYDYTKADKEIIRTFELVNSKLLFQATSKDLEASGFTLSATAEKLKYDVTAIGQTWTQDQFRDMFITDGNGEFWPITSNDAGTDNMIIEFTDHSEADANEIYDLNVTFLNVDNDTGFIETYVSRSVEGIIEFNSIQFNTSVANWNEYTNVDNVYTNCRFNIVQLRSNTLTQYYYSCVMVGAANNIIGLLLDESGFNNIYSQSYIRCTNSQIVAHAKRTIPDFTDLVIEGTGGMRISEATVYARRVLKIVGATSAINNNNKGCVLLGNKGGTLMLYGVTNIMSLTDPFNTIIQFDNYYSDGSPNIFKAGTDQRFIAPEIGKIVNIPTLPLSTQLDSLLSINQLRFKGNTINSMYPDTIVNKLYVDNHKSDSSRFADTARVSLSIEIIDTLTSNLTLYVATTGKDTAGYGTIGNPFATLAYAIDKGFPRVVNTGVSVTINVGAGTYVTDFDKITFALKDKIFLQATVFKIQGETNTLYSGLTATPRSPEAYIYDITGATFSVDEVKGDFLTNGSSFYPIAHNSTTALYCPAYGSGTSIVENTTILDLSGGGNQIQLVLDFPATGSQSFLINNIKFINSGQNNQILTAGCLIDFTGCNFEGSLASTLFGQERINFDGCMWFNTSNGFIDNNAETQFSWCVFAKSGSKSGYGLRKQSGYSRSYRGMYFYNWAVGVEWRNCDVGYNLTNTGLVFDNCTNANELRNNTNVWFVYGTIFLEGTITNLVQNDENLYKNVNFQCLSIVGTPTNYLGSGFNSFGYMNLENNVKINIPGIPTSGTATLSGGTIVVNTAAVTATSRIILTPQNVGSAQGSVYISARTAGTSFTITSTNASDDRLIAWQIVGN